MAIIPVSNPQYKPEDDLTTPGQYLAQCVGVRQGLPNRKHPDRKTLIGIDFAIGGDCQPRLKGKRVSIVCGESIYRDPITKETSYLLSYLEQAGLKYNPRGMDPEELVGNWYLIRVEMFEGRCSVHGLMPMPKNLTSSQVPAAAQVPEATAVADDDGPPY